MALFHALHIEEDNNGELEKINRFGVFQFEGGWKRNEIWSCEGCSVISGKWGKGAKELKWGRGQRDIITNGVKWGRGAGLSGSRTF